MPELNAADDADAFGELYERHFPQVYRFVYSKLRDGRVAEEVTSEVFRRARTGTGREQHAGKPVAAWLYRLAVEEVVRRDRKDRPGDQSG